MGNVGKGASVDEDGSSLMSWEAIESNSVERELEVRCHLLISKTLPREFASCWA